MLDIFKNQKEIQMIIFQLDKEEYAVPINCVQEIIMPQNPTKIPKSPDWVEGVINLRGHVIPIVDGRRKFNITGQSTIKQNDSRAIILDVKQEIIGLIVDSVSEVIHLKTEDIKPAPIDLGEDSDFIWGIGKFNQKLLILINPEKFLSFNEAKDLRRLAKVTEAIHNSAELLI